MAYRNIRIRDTRPEATLIQVANNRWEIHWIDNGAQSRSFLGQHAALQWADGKFSKIHDVTITETQPKKGNRHAQQAQRSPQEAAAVPHRGENRDASGKDTGEQRADTPA